MAIVIVGGTGDLGFGLAFRLAKAGYDIVIGSREAGKAQASADQINEMIGSLKAKGMANEEAVQQGDIIALSVPDSARLSVLELIKPFTPGKVVLDVTIPLRFGPLRYEAPKEGSNAQQTQKMLGEETLVVSGFHTVSAAMLQDPEKEPHGDVLILGQDEAAKTRIMELAEKIGLRAFDAGSLDNARTVEGLTPMIIGLNKRYKKRHIGVELTGI